MRPLWNFSASFPAALRTSPDDQISTSTTSTSTPTTTSTSAALRGHSTTLRRRIPSDLKEDLLWWSTLLHDFNGVLFFNNIRPEVHLYTDACLSGLGGFFVEDISRFWRDQIQYIAQCNAFMAPICPEHRSTIAVHEASAVFRAFQLWSSRWTGFKVVIFVDNTNIFHGITKGSSRGAPNNVIRELHLLAAKLDILMETRWLSTHDNTLADLLSRFESRQIANLCPHWQLPLERIRLPSNLTLLQRSSSPTKGF